VSDLPAAAAGYTALIADDAGAVRRSVRWILEPAGLQVLEAPDGQAALDVLRANKVDVLIADLNMPRMDGLELIRALRADAKLRAIPVLMMTTEMRPQDVMKAYDAGADMYLVKPSSPAVIRYKVLSLLGVREEPAEPEKDAP
jgi:two-component system, chemotaxis family, chemotaxis protein CheY